MKFLLAFSLLVVVSARLGDTQDHVSTRLNCTSDADCVGSYCMDKPPNMAPWRCHGDDGNTTTTTTLPPTPKTTTTTTTTTLPPTPKTNTTTTTTTTLPPKTNTTTSTTTTTTTTLPPKPKTNTTTTTTTLPPKPKPNTTTTTTTLPPKPKPNTTNTTTTTTTLPPKPKPNTTTTTTTTLPPKPAQPTAFDELKNDTAYTRFFEAVTATPSVKAILENGDNMTLLLPSNGALEQLYKSQNGNSTMNRSAPLDFSSIDGLDDILKLHIIKDADFATRYNMLTSDSLYVNKSWTSFRMEFNTYDGDNKVNLTGHFHGVGNKTTVTASPLITLDSEDGEIVAAKTKDTHGMVFTVNGVLKPTMGPGSGTDTGGLRTGAIVAIVIGAVAGLICIAALVYNFTKTRQENAQDGYTAQE